MFQLVAELSRDCSTRPTMAGSSVDHVHYSFGSAQCGRVPILRNLDNMFSLGISVTEAPDDLPTLYKCVESYVGVDKTHTYYERLYAALPNSAGLIPYSLSLMKGDTKLSFIQTANLALIHSQYGWLKGGLTADRATNIYGNPIVNLVVGGVSSPELMTTDQLRGSSSLFNAISPHPLKEKIAPLWFSVAEADADVRSVLQCLNSATMLTHPEVVQTITGTFLPMTIPTGLAESLQIVGRDDLPSRMRQIGFPSIDVATPLPLHVDPDITWNVDHTDVQNNQFTGTAQSIVATEFDLRGSFCVCTGRFVLDQTCSYYVNRYVGTDEQGWCFQRDITRIEALLREVCYLITRVYTTESTIPLHLLPKMDKYFYGTGEGYAPVRLVKTYLEEFYIEFLDSDTGLPVIATYMDMAWLALFGSAVSIG